MASTLNPVPATAKLDAKLEQELEKATGRIRLNDLLAGGLTLIVLTLAYLTAVILIDRWLVLPDWLRQVTLGGYLLTVAVVGYLLVLRPLRRAVNPRFAARMVEATIPESKNAVINWVDLHERELPAGVRVAVGVRAAEGVAEADVNKAVESRRVIWLGAAAGLLLAILAALFVILKPAPFLSLVNRTFNPFTAQAIATRTELTILEPADGTVTITSGEPVMIRVYVDGTVPKTGSPEQLRVRVRYNQAVAEYDELPLEPGGTAREWALLVPQSVVQNGFWYTVAGGDTETAEYRVNVRSRPLFREFKVRYDYPAYTRLKPETSNLAALRAYPGTKVTLTARTNREIKRGWLHVGGQPEPMAGQVIGESKDSLQFKLIIQQPGSYRLGFTSTNDEQSDPTPAFAIAVETDKKPLVRITSPAEPEITLPPDGLLTVDGDLVDPDFGLTAARLRIQLIDEAGMVLTDYAPKTYRDGKSFRREADGTYPTKLEYKDSIKLSGLSPVNSPRVELKESMVLQYWLEADDNRVPEPNTGVSSIQRVRITRPAPEPEKQKQTRNQQQRAAAEQQHNQKQDEQLQTEQRDPPEPLHPPQQQKAGETQEQQPYSELKEPNGSESSKTHDKSDPSKDPSQGSKDQGQEKSDSSKDGPEKAEGSAKSSDESKGVDSQKGSEKKESGKEGSEGSETKKANEPGKGSSREPSKSSDKTDPAGTSGSEQSTTGQSGQPEQAGQPRESSQQQPGETSTEEKGGPQAGTQTQQKSGNQSKDEAARAEQQAQKVQDAIDQQSSQPGEARNAGQDQLQPSEKSAEPKPSEKPADGSRAEQKAGQPTGPEGQPTGQPSVDSKPEGNLTKPKMAESKPEPKSGAREPQQPSENSEATGETPKSPPGTGSEQAKERPQSSPAKEPTPGEKHPGEMKSTDTSNARGQGDPKAGKPDSEQSAGRSKPSAEPTRGQEKPDLKQGSGEGSVSDRKPQPGVKDPGAKPTSSDSKKEEAKPRPEKTGSAQPQPGEESTDQPPGQGSASQDKKTVDPKEIEQAARDLTSGDPDRQKSARDKLDKMMGKEAREQAERDAKQLTEDLQSNDAERRQAAEKKLKDLADQANQSTNKGEGSQGQPLDEAQKQRLKEKARDLTSEDQKKREAAEEEFDKAIGEEKRKQLQQAAREAQSGDLQQQAAGRKKFEDLMKSDSPGSEEQQPSPEEIQKWADKAKDLNSNDEERRQAAEKEFDEKFGKQARDQLQQAMKDPQKAEELKKKLEDMAGKFNKGLRPGGGPSRGQEGSLHKDDPRNRLKSAELQLKTFEEYRNDKKLRDRLGWTQEEYDRFLTEQQKRVTQMREEIARQDQPEVAPAPSGPAPLQVGEGSSGQKVKGGQGGKSVGGAGPGTAPSGYSDAQRKFAEEAAKLRKAQDNK